MALLAAADAAKEKTKLSSRARREEKKLQTIVADYNTLLQASTDYNADDLADLEAIIAASRKPEEFQMVDMPFPWLDRVGRQAGEIGLGMNSEVVKQCVAMSQTHLVSKSYIFGGKS